MPKHTPGPWQVQPNNGAYVKRADLGTLRIEEGEGSRDEMVLAIILTDCPRLDREAEGNARLIASAPDLLKACQAAMFGLRSYQYGNASPELAENIADVCRAALAKAIGDA
jgi:hypothetical protein